MLIGADPLDVEALWERLYVGSAMNGRRGAVINAIGRDRHGAARPARQGARQALPRAARRRRARARSRPYASLQPEVLGFDGLPRLARRLGACGRAALGFRAVKAEVTLDGPYAHTGLHEPARAHDRGGRRRARGGRAGRRRCWSTCSTRFRTPTRALRVIRDWGEFDLFFVETPLWPDDLDGYAGSPRSSPSRSPAGEWLTTRYEFARADGPGADRRRPAGHRPRRRAHRGAARVRDGGERGLPVVPHLWKTGHLDRRRRASRRGDAPNATSSSSCPRELCESGLAPRPHRRRAADGRRAKSRIPQQPGLGVEIDRDGARPLLRPVSCARRRPRSSNGMSGVSGVCGASRGAGRLAGQAGRLSKRRAAALRSPAARSPTPYPGRHDGCRAGCGSPEV